MLRAYNQQTIDIAVEHNTGSVAAETALDDDETVHSDIVHFTFTGNELLATLMAGKVAGLFEQTRVRHGRTKR